MAFNKNLPAEATKIRQYPSVLIANFTGIQEADATFRVQATNFLDRTAGAVVPTTPAIIADTIVVYSDTDTNAELYAIDDQANTIQLTEDGYLGADSTNLSCSTITFDKGVSNMSSLTQVTGWAEVSSVGVVGRTSGDLTVVHAGVGIYTIGFTVAPVTANFIGTATFGALSDGDRTLRIVNYTATTFDVRISNDDGGLTAKNEPFQVIVFGGR